MSDLKVTIGGDFADDGAAFLSAWHQAETGSIVGDRVIAFESWKGLARVLTGERIRLLRYLNVQTAPSISELARGLGRQYRRVHDDVIALEVVGLVRRANGLIQVTADKITADLNLAA